jgi:hypothetical protein
MRQAIRTKYIWPTNHRAARIAVSARAGRMYVPYDAALLARKNFVAAAEVYVKKHGWFGKWHGGELDTGEIIFVVEDDDNMSGFTVE